MHAEGAVFLPKTGRNSAIGMNSVPAAAFLLDPVYQVKGHPHWPNLAVFRKIFHQDNYLLILMGWLCCPIKLLALWVAYLNSNHLCVRVAEKMRSLLYLSYSVYLTLTMLNCVYIKNDESSLVGEGLIPCSEGKNPVNESQFSTLLYGWYWSM